MERQLTDYELVCYEKNPAIGGTWYERFHDKYNLSKYIKLNHKVTGATWHADVGQWEVQIEHEGKVFTDWCNILVNASGLINKWKWPAIEGLHSFEGPLIHSAAWNDDVDLKGKRVAVLGTGSSAIQIIPNIQKDVGILKCFMRGNTWIAAPMPRVELEADADAADKADVEDKNRKIDEINVRLSATSLAASNGETPAEEEVHLDSSTKAASESQGIAKN
ncbi:hypothetical protein LTS18_006434, partial [Coniosporium uncinatum]